MHLQQQLSSPEQELPETITVKEALKIVLTKSISESTGLEPVHRSPLHVQLAFSHPECEAAEEWRWLTGVPQADFKVQIIKPRKQRGSKRQKTDTDLLEPVRLKGLAADRLDRALEKLSPEHFFAPDSGFPWPLSRPSRPAEVLDDGIGFMHEPVWVAGRYNKLQRCVFIVLPTDAHRHISNSPWFIDGAKKCEDSVQELIQEELCKSFRSPRVKFSSAGREDADVKMLVFVRRILILQGTGRPFYFEMVDPKTAVASPEEMAVMQAKINKAASGKVRVRDLQLTTRYSTYD